jgi:integrase
LALFDLGIDSKLRACDLVKLQVRDIAHGDRIAARAIVVQKKTSRPVQFEITEPTRSALAAWIKLSGLRSDDYLFPSRIRASPHLSTRQSTEQSHLSLLRQLQCVFDLNSEVSHRAFKLGVPQQELEAILAETG